MSGTFLQTKSNKLLGRFHCIVHGNCFLYCIYGVLYLFTWLNQLKLLTTSNRKTFIFELSTFPFYKNKITYLFIANLFIWHERLLIIFCFTFFMVLWSSEMMFLLKHPLKYCCVKNLNMYIKYAIRILIIYIDWQNLDAYI